MTIEASKTALNDAAADAALDTLELYRTHMQTGRYADANYCLENFHKLSNQVQLIEDHEQFMELDVSERTNRANFGTANISDAAKPIN